MTTQIQIRTISVDGADLAYSEKGKGVPVVLVHGGFSDLRSWDSQLTVFSNDFRVISYSLRYHYPNAWKGDGSDYTIDVHTRDLAGLLERLEAHPAHIIGTSYGGRIALHLARDRPELVRTLVLAEPQLSPWLQQTLEGPALLSHAMKNYFEPGIAAIGKGDFEEAVRLLVDGVAGKGTFEKVPPEVRRRYMDNIRVQAFPGSPAPFSREEAQRITVPVLLLTGEQSPRLFHLVTEELEKCLPNAEREEISSAAHLLTVFNADEFNNKVLRFLSSH
jgi:non-heme chloroperoxidase